MTSFKDFHGYDPTAANTLRREREQAMRRMAENNNLIRQHQDQIIELEALLTENRLYVQQLETAIHQLEGPDAVLDLPATQKRYTMAIKREA